MPEQRIVCQLLQDVHEHIGQQQLAYDRDHLIHDSGAMAKFWAAAARPQGRFAYSSSKRASSPACVPRIWSTTLFAQSKYSRLRSSDQPAGGAPLMSLTLAILSASFTSLARRLIVAA